MKYYIKVTDDWTSKPNTLRIRIFFVDYNCRRFKVLYSSMSKPVSVIGKWIAFSDSSLFEAKSKCTSMDVLTPIEAEGEILLESL